MADDHEEFRRLANDMFATFAHFEYALKENGFYDSSGAAKANWDAFANSVEIRNAFNDRNNVELQRAIKYIRAHPPLKQVIDRGQLTWKDDRPQGQALANEVLVYVRRVRNNLYHGGKTGLTSKHPERDCPLLRESLAALKACYTASAAIQLHYGPW